MARNDIKPKDQTIVELQGEVYRWLDRLLVVVRDADVLFPGDRDAIERIAIEAVRRWAARMDSATT